MGTGPLWLPVRHRFLGFESLASKARPVRAGVLGPDFRGRRVNDLYLVAESLADGVEGPVAVRGNVIPLYGRDGVVRVHVFDADYLVL